MNTSSRTFVQPTVWTARAQARPQRLTQHAERDLSTNPVLVDQHTAQNHAAVAVGCFQAPADDRCSQAAPICQDTSRRRNHTSPPHRLYPRWDIGCCAMPDFLMTSSGTSCGVDNSTFSPCDRTRQVICRQRSGAAEKEIAACVQRDHAPSPLSTALLGGSAPPASTRGCWRCLPSASLVAWAASAPGRRGPTRSC